MVFVFSLMSHGESCCVKQVSDSVLEALRLVRHYNVAKLRSQALTSDTNFQLQKHAVEVSWLMLVPGFAKCCMYFFISWLGNFDGRL